MPRSTLSGPEPTPAVAPPTVRRFVSRGARRYVHLPWCLSNCSVLRLRPSRRRRAKSTVTPATRRGARGSETAARRRELGRPRLAQHLLWRRYALALGAGGAAPGLARILAAVRGRATRPGRESPWNAIRAASARRGPRPASTSGVGRLSIGVQAFRRRTTQVPGGSTRRREAIEAASAPPSRRACRASRPTYLCRRG